MWTVLRANCPTNVFYLNTLQNFNQQPMLITVNLFMLPKKPLVWYSMDQMFFSRPPANGFLRDLLHNSWKIDSFVGKLFLNWFWMGSVSMHYHFLPCVKCFVLFFFYFCFVHLYSNWPMRKFDIINKVRYGQFYTITFWPKIKIEKMSKFIKTH